MKRTEQGKDEKNQEHHLQQDNGGLLSGLQCNALAPIVHFAHNKVNYGYKCIALEAREQAAIIL